MTPWWELRSGDEYVSQCPLERAGSDRTTPERGVCVLHDGERIFVFEGGYGSQCPLERADSDHTTDERAMNVTEADLRLVARFMGEQTRTERTFLEVVESASDALICGDLPRPPANDTHRALERALALIAPPKSTPAGADTPAG